MERQLGVDMEHDEPLIDNDTDSQLSQQTNELIEGYEEANQSPHSASQSFNYLDDTKRPRGSVFVDEYKLLSRKYSFGSNLLQEDEDGSDEEIDETQYLKMRKQ